MSQTLPFPVLVALVQEPSTSTDKPAPAQTGTAVPGTTQPPGTAGTQQPAAQPMGPCGGTDMFIYMGVFLALMYFMVMRPEQRRRKEQQSMLSAVKVGDRVVTVGGMHGIVTKLTDKTLTLRVDTVQMTFDRVAVARVERDDAAAPAPKT